MSLFYTLPLASVEKSADFFCVCAIKRVHFFKFIVFENVKCLIVILYKSIFSCAVIFANLLKRDIPQVFIFASGHELVTSASGHETFRVLLFLRL